MALVQYNNLNLNEIESKSKTFEFNGETIEVYQYLPFNDKYDLVEITLENSLENHGYNELALDMNFHLNLILMYTNLTFEKEELDDPIMLYNQFMESGLLDYVMDNMNKNEYEYLLNMIEAEKNKREQYAHSFVGIFNEITKNLPEISKETAELINNFDENKYQEVMNFAKTVGHQEKPKQSIVDNISTFTSKEEK